MMDLLYTDQIQTRRRDYGLKVPGDLGEMDRPKK
jgi:hypothetical protein